MNKAILLNSKDNVATVLKSMNVGEELHIYDTDNKLIDKLNVTENIPYGNKLAIKDMGENEDIIKYGEKIGLTTRNIKKYDLVHVHNIKSYNIDIPESVKNEVMKQMNIK